MTNLILVCMLLLFHPSDLSRTWLNSSKLEPAFHTFTKNAQVSNGKPDLMYFVPEVFSVHDFGKKVDQKDVDVCCEMYGLRRTVCCQECQGLAQFQNLIFIVPQLHTTHLSYTEIQRTAETYWRIYGIISVISWRHKHVHKITRISIVVSHFSHYCHDSEIVRHSFYGWILLDNV